MKVFIGSSTEATSQMLKIAEWIEAAGHKPVPWDEPGLFPPGVVTFKTLTDVANKVDAAIFVFSEDDKSWYRSEFTTMPRDNVLIEYGLFLGVLGDGRVIFCRKGNPRIATDLKAVTYVDMAESNIYRAKLDIFLWLKSFDAFAAGGSPVTDEVSARKTIWHQPSRLATAADQGLLYNTELFEHIRRHGADQAILLQFSNSKSKELACAMMRHDNANVKIYVQRPEQDLNSDQLKRIVANLEGLQMELPHDKAEGHIGKSARIEVRSHGLPISVRAALIESAGVGVLAIGWYVYEVKVNDKPNVIGSQNPGLLLYSDSPVYELYAKFIRRVAERYDKDAKIEWAWS